MIFGQHYILIFLIKGMSTCLRALRGSLAKFVVLYCSILYSISSLIPKFLKPWHSFRVLVYL